MSSISHQQYFIFIILSLLVIYWVLIFVEKIELNVSIFVIKRINKVLTSLFSATTVNRLSTMDIITVSDVNADINFYILKNVIGNYKKRFEKKLENKICSVNIVLFYSIILNNAKKDQIKDLSRISRGSHDMLCL